MEPRRKKGTPDDGALARAAGRSSSAREATGILMVALISILCGTDHYGATAQEKPDTLTVTTSSGAHAFVVEVMRTEPQRQRGLMFRRHLAKDHGMLFDFEAERPIMMWMKNTYIPLDMIFISRKGKVVGIARNTEPLSERIIPSGAPAAGVLEVNAGTASDIGLEIGDKIDHPLFRD